MNIRQGICAALVSAAVFLVVPTYAAARPTRRVALEASIAEAGRVGAYLKAVAFVEWADAMNTITGYASALVAQQQAEAAAAAAAQAAAERATQARTAADTASVAPAGPGYPSEAFWHKVAVCEEGGNNDPRYGFFGKIDGAWAGLTWDEQVARARDLWNSTIAAGRDITKVWTSYPSCTGPVF